ncbi:MAG: carboxylating nicotinate-nucleotide diphosphorylase [Proteobacteria bacterium]|nr:carboxylating nicotinate-nucleotide diphosphorylase [Pseudomonadota bacterium]
MNKFLLEEIVKRALDEDIGFGDITSEIIDKNLDGSAYFLAKEDFVLCGVVVAKLVFQLYDSDLKVSFDCKDGEKIKKGQRVGTVIGRLRSILTCERVALNFLQRLSGISTFTSQIVEKVSKKGIIVLDTRKTTPLLRVLEKYAVRVGGGQNHRINLSDGILIKDNHIRACGGITKAVKQAKKVNRPLIKIGVEVKNINELREALDLEVDHILLDNMTPEMIKEAIKINSGRTTLEISGGINLDNISEYAIEGIDYISLGSLTHSAKAVDISLEIE